MFKTPILLITFNRPDHTRKVWEEIKKQRPTQVFVFQDGVREENTNDKKKCAEVKDIFNETLDWTCELKTFYSEKNLGCGQGPVTAISWFFENVEQGIIMEDDCLAHPHLFGYCEELLNKYKSHKEIMAIGTTTYQDNYPCIDSYLFTRYFTGGAWASWQRAWKGFSFHLEGIDTKQFKRAIKKQFYSSAETNWWVKKLEQIKSDTSKKSYWDYQMQIHLLRNNGLAIRPQKNMISNIGFDSEGTHTLEADVMGNRTVYPCLPLTHPNQINVNKKLDYLFMAKEHKKRLGQRIIVSTYNYMHNSQGGLKNLLVFYKQGKNRWKKL